jgi:hypothetical protein
MKAFTIRGVEPEVAEKLKTMAEKKGKSINQLVLDFIKKNLGLEKEATHCREYADLDGLFGSWSDDEFIGIHNKINQSRQIDQELWK